MTDLGFGGSGVVAEIGHGISQMQPLVSEGKELNVENIGSKNKKITERDPAG
jgi:hypothetical protein